MQNADEFQSFEAGDPNSLGLVSDEYESGYRARQTDATEFKTATRSWRAGWQDANRELENLKEPIEKEFKVKEQANWSLFGSGRQARLCDLPFDEVRSDAWKRDWILTDIDLKRIRSNDHEMLR